jgi:hypothetical protein
MKYEFCFGLISDIIFKLSNLISKIKSLHEPEAKQLGFDA